MMGRKFTNGHDISCTECSCCCHAEQTDRSYKDLWLRLCMSEAKTTADKSKGSTYPHQKRRHFGATLAAQQLIVRVPQQRVVQSSRVGRATQLTFTHSRRPFASYKTTKRNLPERHPPTSKQTAADKPGRMVLSNIFGRTQQRIGVSFWGQTLLRG